MGWMESGGDPARKGYAAPHRTRDKDTRVPAHLHPSGGPARRGRRGPDAVWQYEEGRFELPAEPRAVELEYRIIAVNRTGEGRPSNTVVVVL